MKTKRKSKGFTLAEVLIVVAIVAVLLGVSFVAVQNYQRSSTRLEYDAFAKEIFIAAQNHLTEAASQGYLQNKNFGEAGTADEDKKDGEQEAWFLLSGTDDAAIRTLLLPRYAIDATILSGSYIIRYQPAAARVLDVFYSRTEKTNFLTLTGKTFDVSDYKILMEGAYRGDGNARNRERYNGTNAVIGWYGGEGLADVGERLKVPTFEIINAEKLEVKVTDPNNGSATLKLLIVGKTSKAEQYFTLCNPGGLNDLGDVCKKVGENSYDIILDDITTKNLHFAGIMKNTDSGVFVPGEDLEIKVVAYSSTKLSNIAMSETKETNSLFADPVTVRTNGTEIKEGSVSVSIDNIRHLENLDNIISDFRPMDVKKSVVNKVSAKQLTDLSWPDFMSKTGGTDTAIQYSDKNTKEGCFYPVSPNYANCALSYDGQNHAISEVKVDFEGPAGLFGTVSQSGSEIKNLELIDFDITSTSGNAGALVGTATGTAGSEIEITNVVAYHGATAKTVTTSGGDAGGLIGHAENCKVTKSAAALLVSGTANAGGLIGSTSGTSKVEKCYSGGHTITDATSGNVRYDSSVFNVTGGTAAGGLIGTAVDTTITDSYSTCSAGGTTAGGFIGSAGSTVSVSESYCTGLVSGGADSANAFLGDGIVSGSNNYFFEIVNEVVIKDGTKVKEIKYKEAGTSTAVPFDDMAIYDKFVSGESAWDPAQPYNGKLTDYYHGKYNLRTVLQLPYDSITNKTNGTGTDFVSTHYGDWPAPEEFVFN